MLEFAVVIILLIAIWRGLKRPHTWKHEEGKKKPLKKQRVAKGWIVFQEAKLPKGDDRPAAIRIFATNGQPAPDALYCFETLNPAGKVRDIREELAIGKLASGWYDRDMVMAWMDHHKGAYA